ncbi:unannotated protein [freshwater metagenome]|uniref:Unannotated protein n=1 Tax=freshwater metagenome TaxID=449393 RepID=A0A6J7IUW6_9ZZZZ
MLPNGNLARGFLVRTTRAPVRFGRHTPAMATLRRFHHSHPGAEVREEAPHD